MWEREREKGDGREIGVTYISKNLYYNMTE